MKILLLGAAGFIGTNLTIELAKKTEDEITLVDRSKAFFKPIVSMDLKNVHILEADLTVDMDFDSILKDQEVVYHLVSTTVPTTSNQHISQELVSNVIFSANLFEACIRCGVKKVVFVSSGGTVYGKEVDCPLKEKTATNPISSYGVLKANMKIVGATEYALVLYRGKLPKFRNLGEDGKPHMIFNWFDWKRDGREYPKIHPSQKPISVLKRLIETFTDEGDVVIDPCAGSGSTLRAARELGRNSYGFEVSRDFYRKANEQMLGEGASA